VFHLDQYVPEGLDGRSHLIPPAIDPLAPKNTASSTDDAVYIRGHPEVQLALVGSIATDDPEGWDYFNATVAHADGDPDIHIYDNFNDVGSIEVNAFQSHADVVIQMSIREGFGLTVTEALWKARPLIGGDVGGIPLQVTELAAG